VTLTTDLYCNLHFNDISNGRLWLGTKYFLHTLHTRHTAPLQPLSTTFGFCFNFPALLYLLKVSIGPKVRFFGSCWSSFAGCMPFQPTTYDQQRNSNNQ